MAVDPSKPNHFIHDSLGDPYTCTEDHNHPDSYVEEGIMSEQGTLTPYGEAIVRDGLNVLAEAASRQATNLGWYDNETERGFPEEVALFHSEISEALEEYRKGKGFNEFYYSNEEGKPPNKPEGIPAEMGDVLIRMGDTAGKRAIDWAEGVIQKLRYNPKRGYRHGGKKA